MSKLDRIGAAVLLACASPTYANPTAQNAIFQDMGGAITALAASPDGQMLVIGRSDGAILLADPASLRMLRLLAKQADDVGDLAFSPDGRMLAASSFDGTINLWSGPAHTTKSPLVQPSAKGRVRAIAFSPDGHLLAMSFDRSVIVWNVEEGTQVITLTGHAAPLRTVAFSADGRQIASGDEDREIRVWNARTGRLERTLTGHKGKVRELMFLAGDRLASSSSDGTVRFWNLRTGAQTAKLQAHTIGRNGKVRAIAFSADAAFFVTGSEDGTARIWRDSDHARLATLRGHLGPVTAAIISLDRRFVYTGGDDGTVRKWRVPGAEPGQQQTAAAERSQLEIPQAFRDCPDCPSMVPMPVGIFEMGSSPTEDGRDDDEGPRHQVAIRQAFAIGAHEVTWDEWNACVKAGGCAPVTGDGVGADEGWGEAGRPVIHVSWNDAQTYAAWLSKVTSAAYRLPSEAEWEYAARAGTRSRYPFGEDEQLLCSHANGADLATDFNNRNECFDATGRQTAPAGSYAANPFGLFDMLGNLWEWTADCWNAGFKDAPADGAAWTGGDCSQRVLKGGSWGSYPQELRPATRYGVDADYRGSEVGFRLVRVGIVKSDVSER